MSMHGDGIGFSSRGGRLVLALVGGALLFLLTPGVAAGGPVELISVDRHGNRLDGESSSPDLSADGRFLVFNSEASGLVRRDRNGNRSDVFLVDLERGRTKLISVNSRGRQANGPSFGPSISSDGRSIAFVSKASNLARGKAREPQVYVHDRKRKRTSLVSATPAGRGGSGRSRAPEISPDGGFVAFPSVADDLVSGDDNGLQDVFLRDLRERTTELISVSESGQPGAEVSTTPVISGRGASVAFETLDSNLFDGPGSLFNVVVRDRLADRNELISVDEEGPPVDGSRPQISSDGRFVSFEKFDGVFIRDRELGTTTSVDVPEGAGSDEGSLITNRDLSTDGRFALFTSADDLTGVGGRRFRAFVRDVVAETTTLAPLHPTITGGASKAAISDDGGTVAYAGFSARGLKRGGGRGQRELYLQRGVAGSRSR